ncbi:interleukin-12 subunit alpha [Betta splendens]|uniref:Interleukin-12 subunit alpha n=1 Tax=Betta splendens TaxID=158456 RepID=A0A6P7L1A1_BETSP|nr:interleukin-12 subunit alpha [Betta splendens]
MLLVKLYFTPTLLLLLLALSSARSVPVTSRGPGAGCVFHARSLLGNITAALTQSDLFNGINCTTQSVELYMETNTTAVCAPRGSMCTGFTVSEFSEESCMTSIGKDLLHYYNILSDQPDPDSKLGETVLFSLRELMQNCFGWTRPTDLTSKQAAATRDFDGRLTLCKVLRGFQVRSVTINRALGYINSGEHTQ